MSITKTSKAKEGRTLCELLSKGSERWGHMDHGPRATIAGGLIIESITTTADALSWVAALAGEDSTGKIQTAQLKAIIKQLTKIDPTGAPSFIEATKDSSATDGATAPRHWAGEGHAPELRCPELISLEGKAWHDREADLHFAAVRERAAYMKMLDRLF